MMDLQTISEEISKLESQKPSYAVCEKLADMYIIRENLMKKQGGGQYETYNYARGGRGNSNYGMYDNNNSNYGMYEMMGEEMEMRPTRMSEPSMR